MKLSKSTFYDENKYVYIKKLYCPRTREFIGYLLANKDGEKRVDSQEFLKMKKAKEIIFL